MKTSKKISDKDQVTKHIRKLDPEIRNIVEVLRQIILSVDDRIGERNH